MDNIRESALMMAIDYHQRVRTTGSVDDVLSTAAKFEAYMRNMHEQRSRVAVEATSNLPYDPDSTEWVLR